MYEDRLYPTTNNEGNLYVNHGFVLQSKYVINKHSTKANKFGLPWNFHYNLGWMYLYARNLKYVDDNTKLLFPLYSQWFSN